ncbi:MAG: MBL fold metallo-hydrolase [Armatimonadetes bacterium]|nr:MBL fold metallo-hydrolase [Armatimonadota bacterium]MDE2205591.1 MBL fold metallo-hydrolase [Armatimonadota bacterium]
MAKVQIARTNAALIADVDGTSSRAGGGCFWWLGQHSFIVKVGGRVVYIDPFLSPLPARQTPPLLLPSDVTNADLVLVSHGHLDHLDPFALRGIGSASPDAVFVCPKTEAHRLVEEAGIAESRIRAASADEHLHEAGFAVTTIKAKHEFFHEDPELGFPFLGFVLERDGARLYHAGDTIPWDGLEALLRTWPRLDAALVPINGRDAERLKNNIMGNLTFQEAAELAGELNVGLAVPAHYDMFIGNQEDPARFVDFLEAKYPHVPHWVGSAGECVPFGAR